MPVVEATAQGALAGMLSYPLYYALRDCFMGAGGGGLLPMSRISSFLNHKNGSYYQHFRDVSLLATFIDNHDNPRFLNKQTSQELYRNALAMVIFSVGIPMCVCEWYKQHPRVQPLLAFIALSADAPLPTVFIMAANRQQNPKPPATKP